MANETPDFGNHFSTAAHMTRHIGSGAFGTGNQMRFSRLWIPHRCTLTGLSYWTGGTSSGNARMAIYDISGTNLAETATSAQPGATTLHQIAFSAAVTIDPGLYFPALLLSSTTATAQLMSSGSPASSSNEGSTDCPGTITPPTTVSSTSVAIISTY